MPQETHGNYTYLTTNTHTEATLACSATSSSFYLPPWYKTTTLDIKISLNIANLHMINISAHNFHIWQHLGSNRSDVQLQHLTTIPSIPETTRFINIFSIAPCQLYLSTQNHQGILIPSGLCLHIQEYTFQL